jgi:multidrug efflux pump subunit AcrB
MKKLTVLFAYLAVVLLLVSVAGCQKDLVPPPEREVFTGRFTVVNIDIAEMKRTDSVVLTVEDGRYRLDHVVNTSNICSTSGSVFGFGSNSLRLEPTTMTTTNCDSVRVPQGQFKAIFKGDSLILGPETLQFEGKTGQETWEYTFRLKK